MSRSCADPVRACTAPRPSEASSRSSRAVQRMDSVPKRALRPEVIRRRATPARSQARQSGWATAFRQAISAAMATRTAAASPIHPADVEAAALRAQGQTRYAGLASNHEDFRQQAASVGAHWSPAATLRLTALVGQSRDEAQESLDLVITPGSRFDTTRDSASVQADWQLAARQRLSLGSDYLRDQLSSDTPFPVTSRRIVGAFGIYHGALGRQQWSVSARHDRNQQFGERSTGSLAWGFRFNRGPKLLVSYGSAFRAPSFDDLYFPGFGNPALRPETSRTADVGLEQRFAAGAWSLHAF